MSVTDGSERRSTKQESAWLFRIWYTFDHKYPLQSTCCMKAVLLFFSNHELSLIFIIRQQREPHLYT